MVHKYFVAQFTNLVQSKEMAKQDEYTRYTIRIPTPLYERIKGAAGAKSVNAEIASSLAKAYPVQSFRDMDAFDLFSYITAPSDWAEIRKRIDSVNAELADGSYSFLFRVVATDNAGRLEVVVTPIPKRQATAPDDD